MTGAAPQIIFGPPDTPLCTFGLDASTGNLHSSCDISTGSRRLEAVDMGVKTGESASVKDLEALKAEVTDLRNTVHQLVAAKQSSA